MINNQSS